MLKLDFDQNFEISNFSGNGMTTTTFRTTPPSPTYILAFTISDFHYRGNDGSGSIPMKTYARSNAIQGATYSVEIGEKILTAFNDYFGVNYALPKMDQVAVADFPFRFFVFILSVSVLKFLFFQCDGKLGNGGLQVT